MIKLFRVTVLLTAAYLTFSGHPSERRLGQVHLLQPLRLDRHEGGYTAPPPPPPPAGSRIHKFGSGSDFTLLRRIRLDHDCTESMKIIMHSKLCTIFKQILNHLVYRLDPIRNILKGCIRILNRSATLFLACDKLWFVKRSVAVLTFHSDVDPDPTLQFDADLDPDPTTYISLALGPPMLRNGPLRL
jgi:hypothetical protein